jgi:inhibitor of cysteine peptidase
MRIGVLSAISIAIFALVAAGTVACNDDDKDSAATPISQVSVTPSSDYEERVELTDADDGATVKLALGGELIIALESNPSTGFAWDVAEISGPQIELVGEPEFLPRESDTPVVGAPGTQVFTFSTTGTGMPAGDEPAVVQVSLEYTRSFEPDTPPEKTYAVTVEIR